MNQTLRSFLYDPVRARILYDFLSATASFYSIWILFSVYETSTLPLWNGVIYAFIFLLWCAFFGVYTRLRLVHISVKLTALLCVCVCTIVSLSFFTSSSFFLFLVVFVTYIAVSLPRLSFAFTLEQHGDFVHSTLGSTHLPILVVGGGGYIGSHVVEQLLKEGYDVRVFDTFVYGKEVLAAFAKNKHLELIEGDISDMYKLTLAMQGVGAVIHLAGIVGDPACAVDPVLTRHVNIISTRILKESAKAFGVGRFIFASSCSVYGAADHVVDEQSKLNPVSLYAQTKIDSEEELLHDTHDTFHPTILRFATVFGHSRKPRFDLVANLFVAQAYNDGVITLTGADQWRPFIHVSDVARAIILTLKAPQTAVSRKIFNVGDEELNKTIEHMATYAGEIVGKNKKGKNIRIERAQTRNDRRNYVVSFKRIQQVLGFHHSISIPDGMKEMYVCWKDGIYTKSYTDGYYSNLETAKELKTAFHSKQYQRSHISIMSEIAHMDTARSTSKQKKKLN
ncbi:NAD(P)-dependent oxidoreductase [Candidatus Cerribacteria bacterium 'Amazon FNV 2010 28 9']|uniref:NAD(P)-dependent oxidoreductase n=1 Tax=Candidatus Cerribacteria bacterium 'Amazon FNV 2010 28 9' TaxID=2081795 RepID=A0A317JMA9_9BACT|nr:MAG: NAD(P)-dependent oxidoreductase [Candidatus Cerribacteria bacterium 'Amazon FNV 2010 28 9']